MSLVTSAWDGFGRTQGYGPTDSALEPAQFGAAHFHDGIDFAVPCGTPVPAPFGGTVTFAGQDDSGYGTMVRLRRDDGDEVFYGHLSQLRVARGSAVSAGAQLGLSGNSGNSTGCHLHVGSHAPDGGTRNPDDFPAAGGGVLASLPGLSRLPGFSSLPLAAKVGAGFLGLAVVSWLLD